MGKGVGKGGREKGNEKGLMGEKCSLLSRRTTTGLPKETRYISRKTWGRGVQKEIENSRV